MILYQLQSTKYQKCFLIKCKHNKCITSSACYYSRGVLQSLIEKHFPAPDRQKLYSLLGIDLSAKKTPILRDTPLEPEHKGKKKGNTNKNG